MCPYPAGVAVKLELSSEDILSDEEDIKCGKASLQVGSRLLTYKRVPKWRWFRHTHHCHHHHHHVIIIISSSAAAISDHDNHIIAMTVIISSVILALIPE